MDPRFLEYYDRELRHLAESCGEFAAEFPKIAGRLGLEGFIKEFQCPDPYVERLLEGFAYMAARVQLKVDAEYPQFTQHLLEMVYPDYLAPTPSLGIVRLQPDMSQGSLVDGIPVARGTRLKSRLGPGGRTPCQYRTAHAVTLWPIEVVHARYFSSKGEVAQLGIAQPHLSPAALRLRLRLTIGDGFCKSPLDALTLYLRGGDPTAMRLYEQLFSDATRVVVKEPGENAPVLHVLTAADAIRPVGFDDEEALFPPSPRSFQGYRLLREYFAFPDRFMFATITGLAPALRRCPGTEVDILVLFDRSLPLLEEAVDASRFELFCSPVINLFPLRTDRINLTDASHEHHLVPDRSRPLDFEVFSVSEVLGYAAGATAEMTFLPFYACNDADTEGGQPAYYALRREPRMLSTGQRARGTRSSYVGSETFVSLVDAGGGPFRSSLRQLGVSVLCTNRDLPLLMPVGGGDTDLVLATGAPVAGIRFITGPTEPRPSTAQREVAWRLISHLSLNYLSLCDDGHPGGAAALRELLELYGALGDPLVRKQIEGVIGIASRSIHRRLPVAGPVSIGRGLEVTISLDEAPFTGSGPFLLAAVLERFFSRYVSINSFCEAVMTTTARGEVKRWPARLGQRHLL
ncbi:MAG: type VI secretion system baseplate subunit TssF [Rhodospirillales bacterium]